MNPKITNHREYGSDGHEAGQAPYQNRPTVLSQSNFRTNGNSIRLITQKGKKPEAKVIIASQL